ncbi:ATP-binding cassette domain-containing protein [Spiroplasma endosymbiont of Aspidapion aeneum]|uniref:ABC transporter ATP-binding protein n=1 Tax=Spiroplasma endosymbiont of Aspidapion aeneum TaxID=3066276 RepID=UPI00313B24E3
MNSQFLIQYSTKKLKRKGKIMEQKSLIKLENVTKKYKNGNGIFDINLDIYEGEVYGYLGPNGAGKSTTIRQILGFLKPQIGKITINGFDVWKDTRETHKIIGYIPGEIAMMEFMTGTEFIRYNFNLHKLTDWSKVENLIKFWEFDPKIKIKAMSKGMKQKVGLVCAWMHDPKIFILDEPTSGLDPLMQDKFINLIENEKRNNKTVILSSHIFQEIEKTCDRVAIIRAGRIVSRIDMKEIKYHDNKKFDVQFVDAKTYKEFKSSVAEIYGRDEKWNSIKFSVKNDNIDKFIKEISKFNVSFIREIPFTLEEYFMRFYEKNSKDMEEIKNV